MTQNLLFDDMADDRAAEDKNAKQVERLKDRRKSQPKARARSTDPQSSHDAAAQVEANQTARHQREAVIDLVYIHPGRTSKELAELSEDMDRHQVARRLPEAEEAGSVKRKEVKGKQITWWPKSGF